jgi:hypothetical protein
MIQLSQTRCDHRFCPVRHKPHLQFLLSRNSQPSSRDDIHIFPPPCIDVTSTPAKIALISCLAGHISQFQSSLTTDSQPNVISQPDHHFAASFGISLQVRLFLLPTATPTLITHARSLMQRKFTTSTYPKTSTALPSEKEMHRHVHSAMSIFFPTSPIRSRTVLTQ